MNRALPSSATAVAWPSQVTLGPPGISEEDCMFNVAGDRALLYSTEAPPC